MLIAEAKDRTSPPAEPLPHQRNGYSVPCSVFDLNFHQEIMSIDDISTLLPAISMLILLSLPVLFVVLILSCGVLNAEDGLLPSGFTVFSSSMIFNVITTLCVFNCQIN